GWAITTTSPLVGVWHETIDAGQTQVRLAFARVGRLWSFRCERREPLPEVGAVVPPAAAERRDRFAAVGARGKLGERTGAPVAGERPPDRREQALPRQVLRGRRVQPLGWTASEMCRQVRLISSPSCGHRRRCRRG